MSAGMPVLPRRPTTNSWLLPPRYKVTELLGSGAYGSVWEAKDDGTDPLRLVAIKQCKKIFHDKIDCKRILREVTILSKLRHNNVVTLLDFHIPAPTDSFTEVYIIQELCDSDLAKLLKQDVSLEPVHINTVLYNLMVGVNYIHSAGVYHRDLKPANCFVNRDCTVKLGDFGLARAISHVCEHLQEDPNERTKSLSNALTGHVVTRWYRAPELILLEKNYTEAIDVWSVGCIFGELLGMLPGKDVMDRGPLFPGTACFPMSPRPSKMESRTYTHGQQTMMNRIFEVLGTPSPDQLAKFEREDAKLYIASFEKRDGEGLAARFPGVDALSIDILGGMLKFSPWDRATIPQLLDHELFSDIRDKAKEVTAASKIHIDFEKEKELAEPELRKYFLQEFHKLHPEEATTTPTE